MSSWFLTRHLQCPFGVQRQKPYEEAESQASAKREFWVRKTLEAFQFTSGFLPSLNLENTLSIYTQSMKIFKGYFCSPSNPSNPSHKTRALRSSGLRPPRRAYGAGPRRDIVGAKSKIQKRKNTFQTWKKYKNMTKKVPKRQPSPEKAEVLHEKKCHFLL